MKYNDITKTQAAESQLRTAIELFFNERDSISIHTLASAGQEILESLGRKADIKSMRLKMLDPLGEKEKKAVHDHLSYHRNFFKHSGGENISIKEKFNPEYTELILWDAVRLFYFITKQRIPTLIIYDLWAYSKYPSLYKMTPEEQLSYSEALGTATYKNKGHFWDMVFEAEKELKKKISPHTNVLFFDNKNYLD